MCFTEKKLENLHKSEISLLRTAAQEKQGSLWFLCIFLNITGTGGQTW